LLDQIDRPIAAFTGDGAYDQEGVHASVADRHPDAMVIVPSRSSAVPSETAETAPTQRDRHLQLIAERGRMGWQKASGHNWCALVEADIGRRKRVIGDALRSQTDARQATEVAIAVTVLNRTLEMGRPNYVRIARDRLRRQLLLSSTDPCNKVPWRCKNASPSPARSASPGYLTMPAVVLNILPCRCQNILPRPCAHPSSPMPRKGNCIICQRTRHALLGNIPAHRPIRGDCSLRAAGYGRKEIVLLRPDGAGADRTEIRRNSHAARGYRGSEGICRPD
jgi:hypothetical protein